MILNNTSSQPTKDFQQGIQTPPNKANLSEEVNEKTNSNSAESTTRSADDHGKLLRRRSFCKAPGLRRSVRAKRFSYPTASQVTKQDTGKRINNNTTSADVSRVVKEEKSTAEEGKVIIDHCATIGTSSPKDGEDDMAISKRLKSNEGRTFCDSKRDANTLSSTVNHSPKDEVLFDMDALSQFPVECICSPPSLISLNGYMATSTVQQQVLFSESTEDLRKRTDIIAQGLDESIVCEAEDKKIQSAVVHSDEKTLRNRNYQEDTNLLKDAPALRSEWKTRFHTAEGKKIQTSGKALNCAHPLLEELDLPAVSLTSHGWKPTASEMVDEDILPDEGNGLTKGAKTEIAQPEMAQQNHDEISTAVQPTGGPVFERFSPEIEGNVNEVKEQEAAHKFLTKTDNISGFDKQHSSLLTGFCGFSTASGKQVHISESAMKQARKTLSEIDAELDVGDSSQTVKVTREKDPCYSISNRERTSGNGSREANSEGPPYGTSQLKDMPQPEKPYMDASGKNTSAIKEEIKEMALQNSEQSVNELKCKQSESVNDSLLEDLLNDCKRQRRDSLATICEESEGIEEHHGGIRTNKEEVSGLTLRRSDHERSSEYQENITTEYCSSTVPNPEKPRVLFKTASGNPVSVSKTALSKAKTTWNKIDRELALEEAYKPRHKNVESLNSFHVVPTGDVDVSPRSLNIAKDSRRQTGEKMIEESNDKLDDDVLNTLEGKVNITDQDFVSKDQNKSWTHSASSFWFKSTSDETGELSEASFATFSGFQTAGGKKVTLSEETLKRGRDIMRRITADPSKGLQENIDCHSANGKHHCVSKDAEDSLRTGAQVVQSEDKPGTNTTNLISFSGFQTAAGKSVTLSKETLEKGAAIMQQIDKSLEQNKCTNISHSPRTSGFSGFQTAGGQSVKLSREALKKGAAIMQQIDRSLQENSAEHTRSTTSFSGFQTAGGQSVKLSSESLEKGAAIMQQIDRSLQENCVGYSLKATNFSGFQTSSGQSVKLSKESLEKGATIMQQIDRSLQDKLDNSVSATTLSGFQTASGQSVELSKESIEKGATIMQQIERSLQENKHNSASATGFLKTKPRSTSFSGFQTAGGKMVEISESALAKAKETMASIDRELQSTNTETAAVSLNASKKPRERMSIMEQETGNYGGTFGGFFTAGGQKVSVSEQALTKAKAFLQEADSAFNDSKTKDVEVSVREHVVATEVHGRTMSTPGRSCFVEHDEAVSREVLESSEALLAYESVMDASDAPHNLHDGIAVGCSSFNTSGGSSITVREKGNYLMKINDAIVYVMSGAS